MEHGFEANDTMAVSPSPVGCIESMKSMPPFSPVIKMAAVKTTMPFAAYKAKTCALFQRGVLLRKGHDNLLGYNKSLMNLVAKTAPVSWEDADRIENELFGNGTTVDVYGALASDIVAGCTRQQIVNNQAMGIFDTFNRKILSIPAGKLLVHVGVGKDVQDDKRLLPLFSAEYFNAYAEFYEMAGGVFTEPSAFTVKYESDDTEEMRAEKRLKVADDIGTVVDEILGDKAQWTHKWAAAMAWDHQRNGLTTRTRIAVHAKFYIMPEDSSLAIVTNTFGPGLIKMSSTSSGLYAMSHSDAHSYGGLTDPVKTTSGCWKRNAETGLLEMAGIKLGASCMDFTADSVAKMHVVSPEIEVEMEIEPDATNDKKEELPDPSTALYPFVDNKELKGVFVASVNMAYQRRPVLRGNIGSAGFAQAKCMNRGLTRGGGGRRREVTPPRAASPEPVSSGPVKATSDLKYATIAAGDTLFKLDGMAAYDCNVHMLLKPSYTIINLLVWKEQTDAELTTDEEDAKAVQLVDAVASQMRDFDTMAVRCVNAAVTAIDQSEHHLVKKADMTDHELAALTAAKKINANAACFAGM